MKKVIIEYRGRRIEVGIITTNKKNAEVKLRRMYPGASLIKII